MMASRQQLKTFQVRNAPGFTFVINARAVCPKCGGLRDVELILGTGASGPLKTGARSAIRRVEVGTVAACPSCAGGS